MKARIYISIMSILFILPSNAQAQSWLDKAKGALNSGSEHIIQKQTTKQEPSQDKQNSLNLSNLEIENGLREALRIGATQVISNLSQPGGFAQDSNIRIPLPQQLSTVASALSRAGFGHLTDDLENRLNQAAENATPQARNLFISAIKNMSFTDVKNILNGPDDAATAYLRRVTGPDLVKSLEPIISQSLSSVGAISAYDQVIAQYKTLPFVPDIKTNLINYTTQNAMNGLFYYIAQEEAAIRSNPAKHTTDLLKRIFAK